MVSLLIVMMKLLSILIICISLLGCSNESKPLNSLTADFAVVEGGEVSSLYEWLRNHPQRRIVSLTGVLLYRSGVSKYVIYTEEVSNTSQQCQTIDWEVFKPYNAFLQQWKYAHPELKLIAITNIPEYSGGVHRFVLCYELQD